MDNNNKEQHKVTTASTAPHSIDNVKGLQPTGSPGTIFLRINVSWKQQASQTIGEQSPKSETNQQGK